MPINLKPCPFCGEELFNPNEGLLRFAYVHPNNHCILARIGLDNGPIVIWIDEAEIQDWNKRVEICAHKE